jgi:hypothetical protein
MYLDEVKDALRGKVSRWVLPSIVSTSLETPPYQADSHSKGLWNQTLRFVQGYVITN